MTLSLDQLAGRCSCGHQFTGTDDRIYHECDFTQPEPDAKPAPCCGRYRNCTCSAADKACVMCGGDGMIEVAQGELTAMVRCGACLGLGVAL